MARRLVYSTYLRHCLINFTLYSRSYCHLCDDMLVALQDFHPQHQFAIEVIDVDADESLIAQYDELVPVLIASRDGAAPVQLCHYFLNRTVVEGFLVDGARG